MSDVGRDNERNVDRWLKLIQLDKDLVSIPTANPRPLPRPATRDSADQILYAGRLKELCQQFGNGESGTRVPVLDIRIIRRIWNSKY